MKQVNRCNHCKEMLEQANKNQVGCLPVSFFFPSFFVLNSGIM